jgi:hypothetical protein
MESILIRTRQVLAITPARWLELTRTLSPELISLPPVPNEWSALECLQHLIETERDVFPARIRSFLAGQDFAAFDPDRRRSRTTGDLSPVALAEEFNQLRQASLTLLAPLTDADLVRQARHPALGLVTLSETVNTWAAHDLNHTVQAERAVMQPFIRGSGPFRFRFDDHVAKERTA